MLWSVLITARNMVLCVVCVFVSLAVGQTQNIRHIDFKNLSYKWIRPYGSPEKLEWLPITESADVRLVNGQWREMPESTDDSPPRFSGLTLESVQFGYVTGTGAEDAVVILRYDSGGTRFWEYVYVYAIQGGRLVLLSYFHAGDRAQLGLYRAYAKGGVLVTELFDPQKRMGDCCSSGFVRTRYRWRQGKFEEVGRVELGTPTAPSRLPVSTFGIHP